MITTIPCPHCKRCLCIQNSTEVIDLICPGCNARYLANFAVLTGATWQTEQSDSANAKANRIYDLRVLANQTTQSIRLVLPTQKAILSLVPDDRLLLLYAQHSGELALVINLTADWKVPLIASWENHVAAIVSIAAGIVLGGYLVGTNVLLNYLPAKFAPFVGVGLAAPVAFVAAKKLRRPAFIETDEKAIAQLSYEQSLLLKQRTVQEKLETLGEQKRQNVGVQERLKKLHAQLVSTSEGDDRMRTVEKAEALVQEQESLLQKLIAGYERMHERVEIDLSASQLVEALPSSQIFDYMAEMEGLERQREAIELQLHAVNL
jgi:phage FluMu protein Com